MIDKAKDLPYRKVKYGFQASFQIPFQIPLSGILFGALKSVLNVAFPLKPFDLGPCVFPGYFGFGVLDFPWIGYDNVAFSNPHLFMFGARDSAHTDNTVHALKRYPFRAE